jgi:hypothetical protein
MKFSSKISKILMVSPFFLWMLLVSSTSSGQVHVAMDDFLDSMWEPHWWTVGNAPLACQPPQSTPDSGLYNETHTGRDRVARYGYPYHYALMSGINDTLDALIYFTNPPEFKDYDFTGKKLGEWFAPEIHTLGVPNRTLPPYRDSTQIGYRMRGWSNGWHRVPDISELGSYKYGQYCIKLDIWNLPEGHYQLCIVPTDKIPAEFQPLISGTDYEFYPARNLADSCNGYEGCYWRAEEDSDFSAAKSWANAIININPKSVPGWWLLADNALDLGDTSEAISDYDNAIAYLSAGEDPAMPDSIKRPLMQLEKLYIDWLTAILPRNRAQLGP